MEAGGRSIRCVAPADHFSQYDRVGLKAALRKIPVKDLWKGGPIQVGREELRALLGRMVGGRPGLAVDERATWSLRAFTGGYARSMARGVVADFPAEGPYRTLMEGIEAFAALKRAGNTERRTARHLASAAWSRPSPVSPVAPVAPAAPVEPAQAAAEPSGSSTYSPGARSRVSHSSSIFSASAMTETAGATRFHKFSPRNARRSAKKVPGGRVSSPGHFQASGSKRSRSPATSRHASLTNASMRTKRSVSSRHHTLSSMSLSRCMRPILESADMYSCASAGSYRH
jgi:hypothetical protein